MWTFCYCVSLMFVVAVARSTGKPPNSWMSSQRAQTDATEARNSDDFIPILNSGMHIHEDDTKVDITFPGNVESGKDVPILGSRSNMPENNAEEDKETIPKLGSGMNIYRDNDKFGVNEPSVDNLGTMDEGKAKDEENDERPFSDTPSVLDDKKIETETVASDTANEDELENNEEIQDEINVQVNVDTAAEVSTEIRRPQVRLHNGKLEREGKLIIKINVKTHKDEPKPSAGLQDLFKRDEKDYDQKTCDWLNALYSNQNQRDPLGPQRPLHPRRLTGVANPLLNPSSTKS